MLICMEIGKWFILTVNLCIYLFQSYNDVVYCKLNRPNEQTQWKFTV